MSVASALGMCSTATSRSEKLEIVTEGRRGSLGVANLPGGQNIVEVLVRETSNGGEFAVLESLEVEREAELLLFEGGEALHDHLGVREDDAVHAELPTPLEALLKNFFCNKYPVAPAAPAPATAAPA